MWSHKVLYSTLCPVDPCTFYPVALPSPRTSPESSSGLPAFSQRRERDGRYQVHHSRTFLFARILSQGPPHGKELWTRSVPLHPGRENSIGNTQTISATLCIHRDTILQTQNIYVLALSATNTGQKRQATAHVGLDLNLSSSAC